MGHSAKTSHLQVRVTREEKTAIQDAARRARMDMSAYVLGRVLAASSAHFAECVTACAAGANPSYALAELNSFLTGLTPQEFRDAVAHPLPAKLTPFVANYVAAMVEFGSARCGIAEPAWTREIPPLAEPFFGTALQSLRLHLLTHAPAAFRARNIFIDATLGDRV
jgi:hypothetical protein